METLEPMWLKVAFQKLSKVLKDWKTALEMKKNVRMLYNVSCRLVDCHKFKKKFF